MAKVTKIINSDGGGDFTSISDWFEYLTFQSNPDQEGILVKDVAWFSSESSSSVTAFVNTTDYNFSTPTTQDVCPRLIANTKWQYGDALYNSANSASVPFSNNEFQIEFIVNGSSPNASNFQHFKFEGINFNRCRVYLDSQTDNRNFNVWINQCCFHTISEFVFKKDTSANSNVNLKILLTNSLLVGDGESNCGDITFDKTQNSTASMTLVNSVIAKGLIIGALSSESNGTVNIKNCVEMRKENTGINWASSNIALNIENLTSTITGTIVPPIYVIPDKEGNSTVFSDSNYQSSDYRLVANSPLIGLGATVTTIDGWNLTGLKDSSGTARPYADLWDIGYNEYNQPNSLVGLDLLKGDVVTKKMKISNPNGVTKWAASSLYYLNGTYQMYLFPNLKTIDIDVFNDTNGNFDRSTATTFVDLHGLTKLTNVKLIGFVIGTINITNCSNLTTLNLSKNGLRTIDLTGSTTYLNNINLSTNYLNSAVVDSVINSLNASIANGTCNLTTNAPRTSASNTKYNALIANGWTINVDS